MRRLGESAGVAVGLTGLAVALTWPAARNLRSMAHDLGDPLLTSWILAWDLHALGTAPLRLFDANMLHPIRGALAYTEHLLGLVPLVLPLQLARADPLLAHNLVWLATFPLAGLALFWLVRALTADAAAAALAAVLYAFSHFRFGQLGHLQVLAHLWLPLGLLALHRAVERGARWRDLWLAAGTLGLQALTSGYQAFFAATALAVFTLWVGLPAGRPPLGRLLWRGTVVGVVVGLLLLPAFAPYWSVRDEVRRARSPEELAVYSAWPSSYLAAAPSNRWLGTLTEPYRRPEAALFPGIVALALAVPAAVRAARPHRSPAAGPSARWARALDLGLATAVTVTLVCWLVAGGVTVRLGPLSLPERRFGCVALALAAVFIVRRLTYGRAVPVHGLGWLRAVGWPHAAGYYLALTVVGLLASFGPSLDLDDVVLAPLYGQLAQHVPGFDAMRVPARFGVLTTTGIAVLAGMGAAQLARRLPGTRCRAVVLAALALLAAVEAWAVPVSWVDVPTTENAAAAWLAERPGPEAVAILPLYDIPMNHLESLRLLASVAHWRPLVNGYAGVLPPDYADTVATLNEFPAAAAVTRLRALHVRYVVVHVDEDPREAEAGVAAILEQLPPGVARVATTPEGAIFEVSPAPP